MTRVATTQDAIQVADDSFSEITSACYHTERLLDMINDIAVHGLGEDTALNDMPSGTRTVMLMYSARIMTLIHAATNEVEKARELAEDGVPYVAETPSLPDGSNAAARTSAQGVQA